MKFFFIPLLLVPLNIYSQEVDASDILFLKIQELEGELASLRSELESQAYLIEKLLNEELSLEENNIPPEADIDSEESSFRFEGINDSRSIEEVYDEAIFELNEKNIIKSLASFQLSINNLLELITKIKEIPATFSHSDLLKSELDEIKKYKEDTF